MTERNDANVGRAGRLLVGAIRWDAWHGLRGVPGLAVEKSMGPAKYHHRLPFFARVLGPDRVEIRGDRQEVMDREIAYAQRAGVDYWAFVTYEGDNPMSIGLDLYLASRHKADVKFCLITEQGRWGDRDSHGEKVARFVRLMGQPTYVKVLGDRPLLFLGFIKEDKMVQSWGTWEAFRSAVDGLRERAAGAGLANPYIVILDFSSKKAAGYAAKLGADAISCYAVTGGTPEGAPFAELRDKAKKWWDSALATGAAVIPPVSFGWDPTPRVDNPVPWVTYKRQYFLAPTAAEAADHLAEALDWTARHRAAAAAQAVLIYAWNENDEGGWIVPRLEADGSIDDARVRALGKTVRSWRPPEDRSR